MVNTPVALLIEAFAPLFGCTVIVKDAKSSVLPGVLINGTKVNVTFPPICVTNAFESILGAVHPPVLIVTSSAVRKLSQVPLLIETK